MQGARLQFSQSGMMEIRSCPTWFQEGILEYRYSSAGSGPNLHLQDLCAGIVTGSKQRSGNIPGKCRISNRPYPTSPADRGYDQPKLWRYQKTTISTSPWVFRKTNRRQLSQWFQIPRITCDTVRVRRSLAISLWVGCMSRVLVIFWRL